jgi:molecular chaperone DnaK
VPAEQLNPIKEKLTSLKSAIEANDSDKMKTQTEEIEKLFAAAYQAAAAAGAGPAADAAGCGAEGCGPEGCGDAQPKSKEGGKVVDADFEVVDKDKDKN